MSAAFTISSFASGGFSINMLVCLLATEYLGNMQYLNINHSKIASTIYVGMSSSHIPNWIAFYNTLDRETLILDWGIFKKNQISSLYLDNFGDSLTEMMIYITAFFLTLTFTFTSKIEKLIKSFAGKAYVTTFSFFLTNVFAKLQGQILHSVMQLLFSFLQVLRMDQFVDTYLILSLLTGYLTLSVAVGLVFICYFKCRSIWENKEKLKYKRITATNPIQKARYKWLEKKYGFLFGDFKENTANQFLFGFWVTAFSSVYILLILGLQSVPILQCLSIVVLTIAFILFAGITKPFATKGPAFLFFFNYSCVLVGGILNLILAIIQSFDPKFSGIEIQGWVVASVIFLNAAINILFSLGEMILNICQRLKKDKNNKNQQVLKKSDVRRSRQNSRQQERICRSESSSDRSRSISQTIRV